MIQKWLRRAFPNTVNVGCFIAAICVFFPFAVVLYRVTTYAAARSKQARCEKQLIQIGIGMQQYSEDYDSVLPPRQTLGANGTLVSWRVLVNPYIKSKTMFECPSNPMAGEDDIEHDGFHRSYAVNSTSGEQAFGPFADRFSPGLALSKIKHPESVIAIVESTAAFNDFNVLSPGGFACPMNPNADTGNLFSGHVAETSVLYCDGHVRTRSPHDLEPNHAVNSWTTDGAPFSPVDRAKAARVMGYSERQNR
ncbi:DUF1559 domain-containing protein [Capsulimonas corticalis]|nr:DUF1559 domain-containing protein [Capsulimonas corticalis]